MFCAQRLPQKTAIKEDMGVDLGLGLGVSVGLDASADLAMRCFASTVPESATTQRTRVAGALPSSVSR